MLQVELDTLIHRLSTQDNLATEHPLFIVQQKVRVYGVDREYTDTFTWLDAEGHEYEVRDDVVAAYEEGGLSPEVADEAVDENWTRMGYLDKWTYVSAHLTRVDAEQYLKQNAHNMNESRIYVESQHRCHGFNTLIDALKNGELVLRKGD